MGSELLWSAICPAAPGGNTQTVVYTTATNRAARGVEALVAYGPNYGVAFRTCDWSSRRRPPAATTRAGSSI